MKKIILSLMLLTPMLNAVQPSIELIKLRQDMVSHRLENETLDECSVIWLQGYLAGLLYCSDGIN